MTRDDEHAQFGVCREGALRPAVKAGHKYQRVNALPPWHTSVFDIVEADNEDFELRGREFELRDTLKWMMQQLMAVYRDRAEDAENPEDVTTDPEGLYPVAREVPTETAFQALSEGFFRRYPEWQMFIREAIRRQDSLTTAPDLDALPDTVSLDDTILLNRIKKTVLIRNLSLVFTGNTVSQVTTRRKQSARNELRDAIQSASLYLSTDEMRGVVSEAIGDVVEEPPAHSQVRHTTAAINEREVDSAFKTEAYFNSHLADDSG